MSTTKIIGKHTSKKSNKKTTLTIPKSCRSRGWLSQPSKTDTISIANRANQPCRLAASPPQSNVHKTAATRRTSRLYPLKGNLSIFKSHSTPKTLYNSKQSLIYKVTHLAHCIQNDTIAAYKAF